MLCFCCLFFSAEIIVGVSAFIWTISEWFDRAFITDHISKRWFANFKSGAILLEGHLFLRKTVLFGGTRVEGSC